MDFHKESGGNSWLETGKSITCKTSRPELRLITEKNRQAVGECSGEGYAAATRILVPEDGRWTNRWSTSLSSRPSSSYRTRPISLI